jgi:hypothetical protein
MFESSLARDVLPTGPEPFFFLFATTFGRSLCDAEGASKIDEASHERSYEHAQRSGPCCDQAMPMPCSDSVMYSQ